MTQMMGGELIAKMLKNEGVSIVFGIIDGTYFGLYSTLEKNGIKLVSPRHETCAAHMAGAHARLTGKLGVCIASNGPGVANVLPGVAVENGEGNRVLLITSSRRPQISHPDRGGAYQYFNQIAVTKPMTKWSGTASSFTRIPEIMKRAFRKSFQGRPGVVHIDVPENVMNGKENMDDLPAPFSYRRLEPIHPAENQVLEAAKMLVSSRQPIIQAGSGVIHAAAFEELKAVAEILAAPVCSSWGGRGALPETHDLSIPMIHVQLTHQMRNEADLVLVLGSRIGETDYWGKAPYWQKATTQKMIQVDIDEEILGINKPANLLILADIKLFLVDLLTAIKKLKSEISLDARKDALEKYQKLRKKHRAKLDESLLDNSSPMITAHVAHTCREIFSDDAICVIDGGNTAVWANFFHQARVPNTILGTPKFGMLGAGVSQAVAAAVTFPDREVYCIIGDGAMGFHMQEIETAVRYKLKVIYLVCADKQWGMVKMSQQMALRPLKTLISKTLEDHEFINTNLGEIEWDNLAKSMGASGYRVDNPKDLKDALKKATESTQTAMIHVDVDPVKHMWAPSLLDFKKMHEEPKGK